MATLLVLLNDVSVGYLSEQADSRVNFRFADTYLSLPERPVLGQRFEDDLERVYVGKKPGQLPAFFANLLPEGQVRDLIEGSLGIPNSTDLELLAACTQDLPGAIRIQPTDPDTAGGRVSAVSDDSDTAVEEKMGLRFSLAGVQLKFSALKEKDRFTIPAHDQAGDWILKVPVEGYEGLPENEYTVMRWAAGCGFEVPEMRLVRSSELGNLSRYVRADTTVFAIRRFDRNGTKRVHQEDFNQVMGKQPRADRREKYSSSYEELGMLVYAIVGIDGVIEYLRRLLFVVASGNNDAHLKNWSLVYRNGIHATLSPLYDQVSTVAWPKFDREWALKLGNSRGFSRVSRDSMFWLGEKLELDRVQIQAVIDETLPKIRDVWKNFDKSLLLPKHQQAIKDHWMSVPLLREFGPLV